MEIVVATVWDLCVAGNTFNYAETSLVIWFITLNLTEMPYNAFVNRADPDQAALVRAA